MKDVTKTDLLRLSARIADAGGIGGPGSATDGAIAVFDGSGGKSIADSGKKLSASGARFGVVPFVETDGVMEVGAAVDFHNSDTDTTDKAVRLSTNSTTTDLHIGTDKIWHAGNDGSSSGLDADKVDGYDVTIDGLNGIPRIVGDYGVLEIGKYIDFHTAAGQDYMARLTANTDGSLSTGTLKVGGVSQLSHSGNGRVRITSSYGYVDIGANNSSALHFYTDRAAYYFDHLVLVNGDMRPYATGKILGTSAVPWGGMYFNPPTTSSNNTLRRNNSTNQVLYYSSSLRFKENVRKLEDEGIDPDVIYNIKPRIFDEKANKSRLTDTGNIIGFIAEEIEAACPDIVYYDADGNVQSYSEDAMVALLVGAIGKLKSRVDVLEKQLEIAPTAVPKMGMHMASGKGLKVNLDRRKL